MYYPTAAAFLIFLTFLPNIQFLIHHYHKMCSIVCIAKGDSNLVQIRHRTAYEMHQLHR